LRKAITLVMMINLPILLGMAVTARPLVSVLFGARWLPCVPYLQILCLGGVLWPLHILNLNILLAQGYSNLFFRLEIIKKIVGILLMGTACFFGITAIAWSSVLTSIICFWINAHYSGRFLDYGVLRQTIDLLPYAGVTMAMAVCVWAISCLPLTAPILLLVTQVSVGALIYLALCAGLRLKGFVNAWGMVRPVLARRLLPAGA
jgi:O-antigen/teichoic acid export membrane protein